MSIASQNIERELRVLKKTEKQTTVPLPTYECVTLANSEAPGATLHTELATNPTHRSVSLEHFAVHALHTTAPTANTIQLTVTTSGGYSVSRQVELPQGRCSIDEFARRLELKLNENRVYDMGDWTNDWAFATLRCKQRIHPPLYVKGTLAFRDPSRSWSRDSFVVPHTDGALPLAAIWTTLQAPPQETCHVVQSVTPEGVRVQPVTLAELCDCDLSVDSTAASIVFPPQINGATYTGINFNTAYSGEPEVDIRTTYPTELDITFTWDMVSDPHGTVSTDRRGAYDMYFHLDNSDPSSDIAYSAPHPDTPAFRAWPPAVFIAMMRAHTMQARSPNRKTKAYVVVYDTPRGSLIRVTALVDEQSTSTRPTQLASAFRVVYTAWNGAGMYLPPPDDDTVAKQRWPWVWDRSRRTKESTWFAYRFWVSTAEQLATLIEQVKYPDIADPEGEFIDNDHSGTFSWMDRVHPATAILAHTFMGTAVTGRRDPKWVVQLLSDIQRNPRPYAEKLVGRLFYSLVPNVGTRRALTRFYLAQVTGAGRWSMRMTGPGVRALGLTNNQLSADPLIGYGLVCGGNAVPTNPGFGAGFEVMHGRPVCDQDGLEPYPRRLFVFLRINNMRQVGNVGGLRPLAVVPTRKARNDLYEPSMPVYVPVKGAITSIGVDIEDENGAPVAGEYTVMLRLR